jgi:RNA-binding protein
MTRKHIPARRSRPLHSGAGNRSGTGNRSGAANRPGVANPSAPSPYRPKRVRAGSLTAKAKRKRASEAYDRAATQSRAQAEAPLAAPELSEKQRRHLRGLAHALKPVIRVGNAGLTDALASETARALHDHELIKVKGPGGDREARDGLFNALAQRTASALIHRIGNVAVLYRPNATLPKIMIPDTGR